MATRAHAVTVPSGVSVRIAPVVPYILWPCGAALIVAALGPDHHAAWSTVVVAAAIATALATFARTPAAWCVAASLLAVAGTLWLTTIPPERGILWPTVPVNAVRGTVAIWPTTHGEFVQAPITVFAARTDRGWQPAQTTLKATMPPYPPLRRGDIVVVGGIATVRRGWWHDADGSLYGQWMRIEQSDAATTPDDYRYRIVSRFIAGIERYVRPPESGLTAGMVLGEKTTIDDQTRDALNATGTTQHVVISGWNLALVIGLFAALARHAPVTRRALWSAATLGAVANYTFAVGAELSVVRAAVMGCGGLIAPLVGRRADPLVWLGIASAVMVARDPAAIRDLSFLLSCAATFGVLVVAPWLAEHAARLPIAHAFPRLTELLAVGVGAQLMTEPIILHAFGRASLISPLVNLIVEPLVPLIMALGAITALCSLLPFSLPATVAGICTALPASLFLAIIRAAANIPFSAIRLPQPGLGLTLLIYAIPAAMVFWLEQGRLVVATSSARFRSREAPIYAATFAITLLLAAGALRWLR